MAVEEIQIQARKAGIYLPEADLWLDPHGRQGRAFISHAHADHFSRPDEVICSPETAHLLQRRFGLKPETFEVIPFGETRRMAGFELTLHPAGHVVGSAMLHIRRMKDDQTLLFTGDFKTEATRTCPAAMAVRADSLIVETTYGRPEYVLPSRAEVESSILRFIEAAFDTGEVPVLCAYSLGKAQELSALLGEHGIAFQAHPSVLEMNDACRELGIDLPHAERIASPIPDRHAVICPPNAVRSTLIRRLKRKVTAMVSGWGIHPHARYRYQVEEVFPLSDHADYRQLLDFVAAVDPRHVHTIHGSTREFAATLRAAGREAWSLFTDDQLELFGKQDTPHKDLGHEVSWDRPLAILNEQLNEIAQIPSRILKRDRLAAILASLDDPSLRQLVDWLSERSLKLGFGFASMRLALLEAYSIPLADYRAVSDQQQDPARTARILAGMHGRPDDSPFGFQDLASVMHELKETSAPLDAIRRLASTLRHLPPPEVEFVMRVLTREFRIGSREGLVEEAIAEAFSASAKEIATAHMLGGDLGATALMARHGKLTEARLTIGTPIKVMLASPSPDASTIWDKLSSDRAEVWLEDKFDGIRAQLHKSGNEVHLFSRDQRSLDDEFPELLKAATRLPDCLIDGEIIAYEEGRKLTFFDLQKRLGRKKMKSSRAQTDLFHPQEIPVRFISFDLLALEQESLWQGPLVERRACLETIGFRPPFELAARFKATSAEEIDEHFKQARARLNEGLIAKDPTSAYQFGRRGQSWIKLKKAEVTLDCVVVKAQQGHGKRAGVLSDYTFAVRDRDNGQLRVIGKAYSGLTDEQIEELTEHFKKTTIEKQRRVHLVEPTTVLEIAFDSIRPSKRHDSGLAMRFPRIKAIRRDKTPDDIDTLQFARTLSS